MHSSTRSLLLGLLLPTLCLTAACGTPDDSAQLASAPPVDLTGAWEVVNEPVYPYSRNGQRYVFFPDSTVHIQRPPSLGVSNPVLAAYDFSGDTLVIRSPFGTEMLLPEVQGDTLHLLNVGASRPMLLLRTEMPPGGLSPEPLGPPDENGVYDPPSDVAPEDRPPLGS